MSTATVQSAIEFQPPPWPVRRFTVAEYRQLSESGILQKDDRVELLDGWIVPKMTHNPPHDAAVQLCQAAIGAALNQNWTLRIQSAIGTQDSEPEPDLAVVRGPLRRYVDHHPQGGEIGLIIEVAETSLSRDRAKLKLYAAAGIPRCWILNLPGRRLEVYSDPAIEAATYRTQTICLTGDTVPLELDELVIATIPVADLLP